MYLLGGREEPVGFERALSRLVVAGAAKVGNRGEHARD